VGDARVGKSSLSRAFMEEPFTTEYTPTTVKIYNATASYRSEHFPIELWEISSAPKYVNRLPLCYQSSHVILVCFAMDNPSSLQSAFERWLPHIRACIPENKAILLVGTKSELCPTEGIAKEYDVLCTTIAKEFGVASYLECSAATNEGIKDLFATATKFKYEPPPPFTWEHGKSSASIDLVRAAFKKYEPLY